MNRKQLSVTLLLLMICALLCCCKEIVTPSEDRQTAQTQTASDHTEAVLTTVGQDNRTTEEAVTEAAKVVADASVYENGISANMIVGMDKYGRTFNAVNGNNGRRVGIFFFQNKGTHYYTNEHTGVYDNTEILSEYGYDTLFRNNSKCSPAGQYHWWGEPLWGYYSSDDEWVIRKQMELLTVAGVDFVCFDVTNAWTYTNCAEVLMRVVSEMMAEGWDAPQVMFYTHTFSIRTVESLYHDIYEKNLYPETWYLKNGKPYIVGYTQVSDDVSASRDADPSYQPNQLSDEILNFFTFARPQWPTEQAYSDGFPWIEWKYPQPEHNGIMNVAVAAHPSCPISSSLTGGALNWGRGYDVKTRKNISEDAEKGTFFQSEWDTALKEQPDIVFVTGWNEWVAIKSPYQKGYAFYDCVNEEYSRDAEMMKGGYEDSFYLQLCANIRRFKGNAVDEVVPCEKTIDIHGDSSQWDDVFSRYITPMTANIGRNSTDPSKTITYTAQPARNQITEVRIAEAAEAFCFYVRCQDEITAYDGSANWMNLFIGTGTLELKGWEGYEFVINRRGVQNGKSEILALTENGTESVGSAEVTVQGNLMQIRIDRADLGMSAEEHTVYFKVADGVDDVDDIMTYYTSGKSFPMGRLSYRYG